MIRDRDGNAGPALPGEVGVAAVDLVVGVAGIVEMHMADADAGAEIRADSAIAEIIMDDGHFRGVADLTDAAWIVGAAGRQALHRILAPARFNAAAPAIAEA